MLQFFGEPLSHDGSTVRSDRWRCRAGGRGTSTQLCRIWAESLPPIGNPSILPMPAQTRALVRRVQPDVILNAAAYTAVDRAESQRDLAMAINATAPRVLAEEALRLNALLVHYSTDYVFNGEKQQPWVETDEPSPLNVYGATKLAGEQAIEQAGGRYLIFRTSWVYGPHGNNFLLTMLRLAGERDRLSIVDDQFGSPTTSIELARATRTITGGRSGRQVRRGAGLGRSLPHDLRGLHDMVRLCQGHLCRRGGAAQCEAARAHAAGHQGLSHTREASSQLCVVQRETARPLWRSPCRLAKRHWTRCSQVLGSAGHGPA